MTTKASHRLTLKDRLSRLNFTQACKLLGAEGRQLIQRGGKFEIDLDEQVYLEGDLFRVKFDDAVVTITLMAGARDRLHWNCTACQWPCAHAGAAFSLLLEEKTALGLAAPPPERIPVESLGEEELIRRALAERQQEAAEQASLPLMPSAPSWSATLSAGGLNWSRVLIVPGAGLVWRSTVAALQWKIAIVRKAFTSYATSIRKSTPATPPIRAFLRACSRLIRPPLRAASIGSRCKARRTKHRSRCSRATATQLPATQTGRLRARCSHCYMNN